MIIKKDNKCEHKYVHLETIKEEKQSKSFGLSINDLSIIIPWIRIDRFFCEKCLEIKEIKKTSRNWKDKPDWW